MKLQIARTRMHTRKTRPPGRQKRSEKLGPRPIRRDGVTASGDIICPHGIEKRYCLDPVCVANGGGKAMCQHGRRRRCCKESECKAETERKRAEVTSRRCVHGRQKRLCREGDCIKEFSAANKAYRESMQQRRSEPPPPVIRVPVAVKSARKLCEHPGLCTPLVVVSPVQSVLLLLQGASDVACAASLGGTVQSIPC